MWFFQPAPLRRSLRAVITASCERLEARALMSAVSDPVPAGIPAFPGAEGYGAGSVGGRGGEVLFVSNLDDSGPGSLRAAIEAAGPRTVVFRVAGVIELNQALELRNPFITIAGQTAPAPGITLRMNPSAFNPVEPDRTEDLLEIATHDVVVRYLKFRRGDSRQSGDNINVAEGARDVMLDHLSLSWSTDESVEIWTYETLPADEAVGVQRVSFQRSIIGESLHQQIGHWIDPNVDHTSEQLSDPSFTDYAGDVGVNVHPLGFIVGGKRDWSAWQQVRDIDIHHNLFSNNTHRNPRIASRGARVVGNVIYNWFTRASETVRSSIVDYIGNTYLHGPLSRFPDGGTEPTPRPYFIWHEPTDSAGTPYDSEDASLYLAGNVAPAVPGLSLPDNDNWLMLKDAWFGEVRGPAPQLDRRFERSTPLPQPRFPVNLSWPSADGTIPLFEDVGANVWLDESGFPQRYLDFVDLRQLRGAADDSSAYTTKSRIYKTAEQAGGYSAFDADLAPVSADSDLDGLPDGWEARFDFAFSANGDEDRDGYTNLEEFLNSTHPFHDDTAPERQPLVWQQLAALRLADAGIDTEAEALRVLLSLRSGQVTPLSDRAFDPDIDRDQLFSAEEQFALRVALALQVPSSDVIERALANADRDADGVLTSGEFRASVLNATAQLGRTIRELDLTGDGQVLVADIERAVALFESLDHLSGLAIDARDMLRRIAPATPTASSAGVRDALMLDFLIQQRAAIPADGALYDLNGDGELTATDRLAFRMVTGVSAVRLRSHSEFLTVVDRYPTSVMSRLNLLEGGLRLRRIGLSNDALMRRVGELRNVADSTQIVTGLTGLDPDLNGLVTAPEFATFFAMVSLNSQLFPLTTLHNFGIKHGFLPQ